MAARRLGQGYSIALKTSDTTHCSLVYFQTCRRGYEREQVKMMATEYFRSRGLTTVDFELGGSYGIRSVLVRTDVGLLASIARDLNSLFASFDIDRSPPPLHIDLRGSDISSIQTKDLPLIDNWWD
eukprot:gnl/Spiro4/14058_TR7545_c0_g1_i1.p1 gnl/Spiro4/14058_TR7545_c0_g1~~gnl/Spiro4/14058_TR7545_c0_g1_i1.p1  ORF type:complete len:126 (-),score=25.84 gnl/Spiro4/14058_TR7545_c0_g1_i1:169-546(-)